MDPVAPVFPRRLRSTKPPIHHRTDASMIVGERLNVQLCFTDEAQDELLESRRHMICIGN